MPAHGKGGRHRRSQPYGDPQQKRLSGQMKSPLDMTTAEPGFGFADRPSALTPAPPTGALSGPREASHENRRRDVLYHRLHAACPAGARPGGTRLRIAV